MGIKITYDIDRQTAIAIIVSKVNGCTNDQLANMLDEFEESHFRNYRVYDELPDDSEDCRTIRNFSEF